MKTIFAFFAFFSILSFASGQRSTRGDACALRILSEARPALKSLLERAPKYEYSVVFFESVADDKQTGTLRFVGSNWLDRGRVSGNVAYPVVALDKYGEGPEVYYFLEKLMADGLIDSEWISSRETAGVLKRVDGQLKYKCYPPSGSDEEHVKLVDGTWLVLCASDGDTI